MCVYSMVGDSFFKWTEPPIWPLQPWILPLVPALPIPTTPPLPDYTGWDLKRLRELLTALELIRKLEGANCPCEREKVDYILVLKTRIAELEKLESDELAKRHHDRETCPACIASDIGL